MNAASCGPAFDAIQYHDRLAIDWDRRYQKASFRARVVALAECLDGQNLNGTQWLDAGCGTGTLSRWLAGRGCEVLGIDAAPNMVSSALSIANSAPTPGSVSFRHIESVACLPLDWHSVDGILCSSVLEYVSDPESCLAEFSRVLRSGGMLVVSVPSQRSFIRRAQIVCNRLGRVVGRNWCGYLDHSRHQHSQPQFERMLKNLNFRVERILPFGGPFPLWMQRTSIGATLLMFVANKL